MADLIHIIAGCLLNEQQQLLLVRKRGTTWFMLPGGKPEHGETPMATLAREWQEELGSELAEGELVLLGRFRAPAANEPETLVDADAFIVTAEAAQLQPTGEIEEIRWLSLSDTDTLPLAPLLKEEILPALRDWL